ncbi:MAG: ankyrin repeat domain-containing protein, partial [Candidatus Babeliales bacterium]
TLNNKTDEVHSLIQFKANVNRKNKAGNTPLMVAASKGHDEIVKRLLDANADPLLGNNTNEVALFFAVMNKHESTALLISKEISKKRKT